MLHGASSSTIIGWLRNFSLESWHSIRIWFSGNCTCWNSRKIKSFYINRIVPWVTLFWSGVAEWFKVFDSGAKGHPFNSKYSSCLLPSLLAPLVQLVGQRCNWWQRSHSQFRSGWCLIVRIYYNRNTHELPIHYQTIFRQRKFPSFILFLMH